MSESDSGKDYGDRREHTRLSDYCDVDFSMIRLHGDLPGINWQKGTTRNISQGGMYLETDSLDFPVFKFLSENQIYLDLLLHIPWVPHKVKAVAEVAWFREPRLGHYEIGLEFKSITDENLKLILRQASGTGSTIRILQALAVIVFFGFLLWATYQFFI